MATCENCGAKIEKEFKFCQECGAPVKNDNRLPESGSFRVGESKNAETPKFAVVSTESNFTESNFNDEYSPEDVAKNKLFAVLSYFGLLVLIPILVAKDSKFARFHANQGLVLFLAGIISRIFIKIVRLILGLINPYLTLVALFMSIVINIGIFVFSVMGIVYAAQGMAKGLPIISEFKIIK